MHISKFAVRVAIYFWSAVAVAQAVDNTASFRMMPSDKYVRIHYENDYFTNTDVYYTQGINIEVVNPSYRKFFLGKLLFVPASTDRRYGISLEHNGYTPTSITHNNILYGDRPFAAVLFLKTFVMGSDTVRHYRVTSSLSTGIIGTAASGYWMQRTIHRWLHGTPPKGWQNQIKNDVVLNYEMGLEKNFFHAGRAFLINGFANARAGTLSDKLSTGLVVMAGRLNSALQSAFIGRPLKRKFTFDFFAQPLVNLVGYDATMQGGMFNRESPYTISARQVSRVTFQANYGLAATFGSLYLEYFQSIISKEFDTGTSHRWGGIRIGVAL